MATTPSIGQVWRSNKDGREVEIEDIVRGDALVRDVDTARASTLGLFALNRAGATGWTYMRQAGD